MSEGRDGAGRREASDEILVEGLAAGLSFVQAGDLAGVSSKTVQRRLQDPEFARRVSRRRDERVGEVTGLLVDASHAAVGVLREGLGAERFADRLRSAQLILTMSGRFRELEDLSARLAEVEARLNEPTSEEGRR
jgi:hypothetical protein